MSRKRAALLRIYAKRRRLFLEANPWCRCGWRPATEVHHMAGRVGGLLLDESKWLGLCHECHQWVSEHPREAKALGLSLDRISAEPASVSERTEVPF